MKFNMAKLERINGKLIKQESLVKLETNPLKVYSRQSFPKEGLEVLYKQGFENNHALINPNGFPWINIKLDPNGSTMRKDQHHTIMDAGYNLVVAILEHLFSKYGTESISMVRNKGTITWDNKSCWEIEMNNPFFGYINYTVKEGETLVSIADRLKLSEYMILENNSAVSSYEDVSAGQVIKIPNDYSPRIVLFIEKERMIPLVMKIYDDKGLYEQYEYRNITINSSFDAQEFSATFHEYDF